MLVSLCHQSMYVKVLNSDASNKDLNPFIAFLTRTMCFAHLILHNHNFMHHVLLEI